MSNTKICKQCGRELSIESFRKYPPRGRGAYATKQGHHTICSECEIIERAAMRVINGTDKSGREEKLKEHYARLAHAGHEPITKYARLLMGLEVIEKRGQQKVRVDHILDSFAEKADTLMDRLQRLLDMPLDGMTPEEYSEHVSIGTRAARRPDGKALPQYQEILDAIADREMNFEEEYE